MIHLFLDTNIYLNFYDYSDDEIDELKKILVSIDHKKIKLYTTEQVYHEFKRNREWKIHNALKLFHSSSTWNLPNLIKEHDQYNELLSAKKSFEKTKTLILSEMEEKIESNELEADILIKKLFKASTYIKYNEDIINKAKNRFDLWNPPWKDKSYWDSINREILLNEVPLKVDLVFIADDKDYRSIRDSKKLNPYLFDERYSKKESRIFYYTSLSSFFKERFPSIKLSTDMYREFQIDDFINSISFAHTRSNLRNLQKILPLQENEYIKIIDGMLKNEQIYQIWQDDDINKEFHQIIDPFFDKIPLNKQYDLVQYFWSNKLEWLPF